MGRINEHPIIVFVISVALVATIFFIMTHSSTTDIIDDAARLYTEGEKAQTVFDRQTKFNQALQLYLDLEKRSDLPYSDGKLYYNIGNTFYQLSEYPLAILYYYKAQQLNNDARIRENLKTALEHAHVTEPKGLQSIADTVALNDWTALSTRWQLFSAAAIIAIGLFSLWIWLENPLYRLGGYVFAGISAFFLFTLLLDFLLSPQESVLINSENLRKGASTEFASVTEEPIPAGSLVYVVGEEGGWLKIMVNEEKVGFVPGTSVRRV